MIEKPDDREPMSNRARRYVRGIVVAVSLTFAALLFLFATMYGENRNAALAQPEQQPHHEGALPAGNPATLVRTGTN